MRKLFLFFSVISATISYTQVEWVPLEIHIKEQLNVRHISDDGQILGTLKYPPSLILSDDIGETWTVIEDRGILDVIDESYIDRITMKVNVDDSGDFYVGIDTSIYKINKANNELELFTEIEGERILEFMFLDNGNFVIENGNHIYLFSSNGMVLQKQAIDALSVQLISGSMDSLSLYLAFNVRDTTFEIFSEVVAVSFDLVDTIRASGINLIERGANFQWANGRFFNNYGYSDDGNIWTNFPDDLEGLVTLLPDGRIHLTKKNEIYISSDNAESFELLGNTVYNQLEFFSSYPLADGSIWFSKGAFCNAGKETYANIYFDEDLITWEGDLLDAGLPYAWYVEAATEDNIILGSFCNNNLDYERDFTIIKNSSNQEWQELGFLLNEFQCIHNRITSMSDGTLLTDGGCFSADEGETWEKTLDNYNPYPGITLKNDIAYTSNNDKSFVSEDFGRSWESVSFSVFSDFSLSNLLAISASQHLFFLDFGNSITKTTLRGEVVSEFDFEDRILGFATAYDGPEVYFLSMEPGSNNGTILYYSYDDGESYMQLEIDNIPFPQEYEQKLFKTDHLGNVYLVHTNRLWMSSDKGQNWDEITPPGISEFEIMDLEIGWDDHLYLALIGSPILKSKLPVSDRYPLTVMVYDDANLNCEFDANEQPIAQIVTNLDNGFVRVTNAIGETSFLLHEGNYVVTTNHRTDLYQPCATEYQFRVDQNLQLTTLEIPLQVIESCADVNIGATTPFLRRCFPNTYNVELYNDGTSAATNLELRVKMDPYFEYLDSDWELLDVTGDIYTFSVGELAAKETIRGRINFKLDCMVDLGVAHYLETEISYETPCLEHTDFSTNFECRTNIGSYDPNDKSIYVEGVADAEVIGENSEIDYLIRFQNTGTDTAFTVRIEDSLTEDFDISSVRPVAASHDFEWELNRRNFIVTFEDIQLVDSTRNEKDSHGFIKFNVRLRDERPEPGETVENTTEIYFDFNEPIVTNTVETFYLCQDTRDTLLAATCEDDPYLWTATNQNYSAAGTYTTTFESFMGCDSVVVLELSILDEDDPLCEESNTTNISAAGIEVYPNPACDMIYISQTDNRYFDSYQLYSLQGIELVDGSLDSELEQVDLRSMQSGLYMIRLTGADDRVTFRKVVVASN